VNIVKSAVLLEVPSLLCSSAPRPIRHDQLLPSGKTMRVTSFRLEGGVEHDERDPGTRTARAWIFWDGFRMAGTVASYPCRLKGATIPFLPASPGNGRAEAA